MVGHALLYTLHMELQTQGAANQFAAPCGYRVSYTLFICVYPGWDSSSAMCYFTNQWITYNLLLDLINMQLLSEIVYIVRILTYLWGVLISLYMCLLTAHVKMPCRLDDCITGYALYSMWQTDKTYKSIWNRS